jgi:hypothetical protein
VSASSSLKLKKDGSGTLKLKNGSNVASGDVDIFALTGTSPELPDPAPGEPGSPGSSAAIIDLAAVGVREPEDGVIQFGIATYDRRTVLNYPAEFDVYVDSNNDGTDDYALYNAELGGFAVTGQTVVYVADLATGASRAYFFDQGGFDSSTQILSAPAEALGIAPGQTFGFSVYAVDNYFTGSTTDAIEGQTFTSGEVKYTPSSGTITVPAKSTSTVAVQATGATGASTQTGMLLLYGSAATADWGLVQIAQ